jgi:hypothetical protein
MSDELERLAEAYQVVKNPTGLPQPSAARRPIVSTGDEVEARTPQSSGRGGMARFTLVGHQRTLRPPMAPGQGRTAHSRRVESP